MPLLRAREIDKVVAQGGNVADALLRRRDQGAGALPRPQCRDVRVIEDLPTPGSFEPVDTAADDVAIIAFTSGTTGTPKGCVHFHRDLLATCDTFARHVLDPQPTTCSAARRRSRSRSGSARRCCSRCASARRRRRSPPDCSTRSAARGRPAVHRADRVPRAAQRGRARTRCARACPRASRSRGRVGRVVRGTGIRIIDGIGSTEILHIFIASPPRRRGRVVRAAGPGYEARIVGEDMQTLPPGEVGRARGPRSDRLPLPRRPAPGCTCATGWNLTGDAFSMDADGYFWFQARTDDMIISSGYNISGFEVEAALLEHPPVAECAVVAAPDEERGHIVMAYVVASEPVAAGVLQDHVKERIAPYKYPRRIEFLDALPRTPTGKVQRNVLRERA